MNLRATNQLFRFRPGDHTEAACNWCGRFELQGNHCTFTKPVAYAIGVLLASFLSGANWTVKPVSPMDLGPQLPLVERSHIAK